MIEIITAVTICLAVTMSIMAHLDRRDADRMARKSEQSAREMAAMREKWAGRQ